ncbi:MAG: DUF5681 domain-containing protein [Alphaproteobacteria bacterium]
MTNKKREDAEYKVGYGKPPSKYQFKKGQSGNRKGRPKGIKNLKTDVLEELAETVSIQESGTSKKVTKQRAMIKSLVARGVKGNDRAAAKILDLCLRFEDFTEGDEIAGIALSREEADVLEGLKRRIREEALSGATESNIAQETE